MCDIERQEIYAERYDIVICGAGIAGLWLLNILSDEGFSVLLIEQSSIGGVQTMASQGMIHGGQRYALGGNKSGHSEVVSHLPARWDACLMGHGEIDLRTVHTLSETQVMWPVGTVLSKLALGAASNVFNAKTRKLSKEEIPQALTGLGGMTVYELPEKVLDVSTLVEALAAPHSARIRKGFVQSLTRAGSVTINGSSIDAQLVICAGGLGNERFLSSLKIGGNQTQQRPIRQIMVKTMPLPLFGHGVTTSFKPEVTVTSHRLQEGGYVWYIGGSLAESSLALEENDAIEFAKRELRRLFSHFDWSGKKWAIWDGVRAESYSDKGRLPDGPTVQEYGNVLVLWPTKLTLTPALGDLVLANLAKRRIRPRWSSLSVAPLDSDKLPLSPYPWESACWFG